MNATTPPAATVGLRGIGYLGRDQHKLITELVADAITTVIDVRLTPISRKPGLSKTALATALRAAGINYIHHAVLGNPKDNRDALSGNDQAAAKKAEEFYRDHIDNLAAAATLHSIAELATLGKVALLCACLEEARCHRRILLDILKGDH